MWKQAVQDNPGDIGCHPRRTRQQHMAEGKVRHTKKTSFLRTQLTRICLSATSCHRDLDKDEMPAVVRGTANGSSSNNKRVAFQEDPQTSSKCSRCPQGRPRMSASVRCGGSEHPSTSTTHSAICGTVMEHGCQRDAQVCGWAGPSPVAPVLIDVDVRVLGCQFSLISPHLQFDTPCTVGTEELVLLAGFQKDQ